MDRAVTAVWSLGKPPSVSSGGRAPVPSSGHRCLFFPTSCLLVRVLFRPASSRRASPPKPISCRSAACGCMRSSMTASASLPARMARSAGSTAVLAMDCPAASREALDAPARLRSRSCIIDGEAVACDDSGVASFDLVRHHRANESIFLYAFDLIELNGDDLRRDPLEVRKATLASIVAKAQPGIRFNEHIEGDGPTIFAHACKMGLEGIVSKRKDSMYRSGRSPDWLKMKNPGGDA